MNKFIDIYYLNEQTIKGENKMTNNLKNVKVTVSKLLKIITKLEKDQTQLENSISKVFDPSSNNYYMYITSVTTKHKFMEFISSTEVDENIEKFADDIISKRNILFDLKMILRDANNSMNMEEKFAKHANLTKLIKTYKEISKYISMYENSYSDIDEEFEEIISRLSEDTKQIIWYKHISENTKTEINSQLNKLNIQLNELNDEITRLNHSKMVEIPEYVIDLYNDISN